MSARGGAARVAGATDRVVVVGAGLAGLSAALHLAAAGRQVTVVEREPLPGGRAGRLRRDGYTFDTGPTVLTMPGLLAEPFAAVGERLEDWVRLRRLDPAYRAHFPDGSVVDVHTDPEVMAERIRQLSGAADADGYRRLVAHLGQLYRVTMPHFVTRNLDSPWSLLGVGPTGVDPAQLAALLRLVSLGGFGRLAPMVHRYLADPRLRRIFTFQSLYAGVSPFQALALYGVITYMDCVAGVYFPDGGVHALPEAMAAVARRHGVELRMSTTVERVEFSGRRARAVITTDGERIGADVVVLNPDLPHAYQRLLPAELAPRRLRRLRYSPSCVLLHLGADAHYRGAGHHNIHFGRHWRRAFAELIDQRRPMSDPSLLVTNASRSDPTLAPAGRHTYQALLPVPHLDQPTGGHRGRSEVNSPSATRYRDAVMSTLERLGYVGIAAAVETERIVTPQEWGAMGHSGGTPFATAHTFTQTGPFRPANLAPGADNVVFCGSGTHPGVGVPTVMVSGRLAAERITGSRDGAGR